jgi:colanic acid/amylovoran biosynthesis glycosyltransferase
MERVVFLDSLPQNRISKLKLFFTRIFKYHNLRDFLLFFSYINYLIYFKKRYVSFYAVIHFLGKPDYDIIHAHYGMTGNSVVDLMSIGLFKKAKLITTFHGFDFKVPHNKFYSNLFKVGNQFTVNTNYSKGKLIELDCPTEKISILPVGLDIADFNKPFMNPSGHNHVFTIVFIGRLVEIKAPEIFLDICAQLKVQGKFQYKAIMIGDGDQKELLNQKIKLEALSDIVLMTGAQTRDEIKTHLFSADILIMTGREIDGLAETQGLVIQEAQLCGLPVIIANVGGMREGIIENETGFVVVADDVNAYVEKVNFLHDNSVLKNKMGAAGKQFVTANYDSKILNERLLNIYETA